LSNPLPEQLGVRRLSATARATHEAAASSILLTPAETSHALRIAVQTLARWRCEGRGPAFVRMSGNRVFYRLVDLDAFLAGRRFQSTAEADAGHAR
jgi:Helix-turn-helix domain